LGLILIIHYVNYKRRNSKLIAHGADIATVSKRLGHSRISTTTDIYTHVINKMDLEAAKTLDNIFAKKN